MIAVPISETDRRPADEFCGFCGHHMDPHDYTATGVEVPCAECPKGICPRDPEDPYGEACDLFEDARSGQASLATRPDPDGAR